MQIQRVEILSRLFGPEHPKALRAEGELAGIYGMQGRLREAEELGRDVLRAQVEVLGEDHPDVAGSKQILANTCQ